MISLDIISQRDNGLYRKPTNLCGSSWSLCCFSNITSTFLPSKHFTFCSLCQELTVPRWIYGSFLYLTQVFAQFSSSKEGFQGNSVYNSSCHYSPTFYQILFFFMLLQTFYMCIYVCLPSTLLTQAPGERISPFCSQLIILCLKHCTL